MMEQEKASLYWRNRAAIHTIAKIVAQALAVIFAAMLAASK